MNRLQNRRHSSSSSQFKRFSSRR